MNTTPTPPPHASRQQETRALPNPYARIEGVRALFEMGSLAFMWPWLGSVVHGDGHGVFVIPGFGADDRSTYLLRRYLERIGYRSSGWELGRNLGIDRVGRINGLLKPFLRFQREVGGPVSIVGWSLGGVHARRIAQARPDLVRQVICLGSPIRAIPIDVRIWDVHEHVPGGTLDQALLSKVPELRLRSSIPSD